MRKIKFDSIILDTETTGLLEPNAIQLIKQPYMIEIYAARLNNKNKIIDELETFFTVPIKIEHHIKKITGIDESMTLGSPEFIEIYDNLCDLFLGAKRMIGHNLPFDAGMLWVELSRIEKEFQFPWPPDWYCTIEKSMHLENKRLKLSALHKHATGKEHKEGAHRARKDVEATLRCYKWMIKNKM